MNHPLSCLRPPLPPVKKTKNKQNKTESLDKNIGAMVASRKYFLSNLELDSANVFWEGLMVALWALAARGPAARSALPCGRTGAGDIGGLQSNYSYLLPLHPSSLIIIRQRKLCKATRGLQWKGASVFNGHQLLGYN